MSVVSWNAQQLGMDAEAWIEALSSLDRALAWDVLCVQEAGAFSETVAEVYTGHLALRFAAVEGGFSLAIVVRDSLRPTLQNWVSVARRHVWADFVVNGAVLRVLNSHLPHSGYSDEEWQQHLEEGAALAEGHSRDDKGIEWALDANAGLYPHVGALREAWLAHGLVLAG